MTTEIIHDAISPNAIYTPAELARLVKCSDDHIRNAIKRAELKGRRNGRNIVIFGSDAVKWINSWPIIDSDDSKENGVSPGQKTDDAGALGLASALSDQRSKRRPH